ncbi:MAG: hypothetical protein H0V46_07135 [Sphingomonas sp.]|nr:hypothetical protein [Sphingomonas sp.]
MEAVTATAHAPMSDQSRARLIGAAGVIIIFLGAGAAALPLLDRVSGSRVVGVLLMAAGIVEILAGSLRRETRLPAMLAGGVTAAAALWFLLNQDGRFVPAVTIVTAWLLVRSLVLGVASRIATGAVRTWITFSAATDFLLGVVLIAGISIATLVVTLFGPTPALVASFAWVLALSFVITGALLMQIASCERDAADGVTRLQ